MTPVERITAALSEREAMLDKATGGLWRHYGIGGICGPDFEVAWEGRQKCCDGCEDDHVDQPLDYYDAALIVAAVNQQLALIDHARDVLARHREADELLRLGDCCSAHPCCWGCGRFASGNHTHRYALDRCPEIASLLAAWCGP